MGIVQRIERLQRLVFSSPAGAVQEVPRIQTDLAACVALFIRFTAAEWATLTPDERALRGVEWRRWYSEAMKAVEGRWLC